MYTNTVDNCVHLWYCVHMKKISVREFRNHISKYLKELPIMITRHGVEVALVEVPLPSEIHGNVLKSNPVRQKEEVKLCKHGSPIGLCKYGCTK